MLPFLTKSVAALASLQVALASPIQPSVANGAHNGVYYTSWSVYARAFEANKLPASDISHVYYAFLNFGPNGTCVPSDSWADTDRPLPTDNTNVTGHNAYGNVKQLYQLKKDNRHLKTLLSIGGWSLSTNFPAVASTAATRSNFAKSAVGFLKDWGFDGLDVDWEYPETEAQASDMVLLLQAMRDELDAYAAEHANGHHFLLTIAAPAGPQRIKVLKLREIGEVVDHVNLMGYDYAGSWDNTTGYLANVFMSQSNPISTKFSTDDAIKLYLDGGVPPFKLNLGMPTYGRAFQKTTGIGKPYTGIGPGEWEAGAYDYKSLPRGDAKVTCDEVIIGCYSYDNTTQELVSFDTPVSVRGKVAYAKQRGFAGSMFWEASGDKQGEESLIGSSHKYLGGLDTTENWLSYPDSQYDNIAAGLP